MTKVLFLENLWNEKIGIMMLSSILKENGHDCDIFIGNDNKIINYLEKNSPDVIAFSCMNIQYEWVKNTCKNIKNAGFKIPIIVGGPHPTFFPEIIKDQNINIICLGEGEYSILELADKIERGEEIKYLKNNYEFENVSFYDECLTTNRDALISLCESLKKLNIKWGCSSRVNLVDEKILRIMKDGGCRFIGFGIESGSQKMLDSMNKMTTVEQGKNAIRLCKKVGIFPQADFIVGTPGETKETIQETVKFCKEVKLFHRIRLFWMTAFPNTPLYDYAIKNNMIKDEKKYIESLSGGIDSYRLNFSSMSMKEIKREKEIAEKSCQTTVYSKFYNYLKYFGVKDTLLMFTNKIKEVKKVNRTGGKKHRIKK
jgi:radical SAM superfamily enzyme YgiQ (UPF0313 family)